MSFRVYSCDNLPGQEWANLTADSLLSSPGFLSLWRIFGGREIYLAEEIEGKLVAGMAGAVFGGKFLSRFQSMPEGLYGGVFYATDIPEGVKGQFNESLSGFLRSQKYIRADIYNPPFEFSTESFICREATAHIISLAGGSYEVPNERVRRYIRHAKKVNLEVTALNDEKYLDDFYRLVTAVGKRHKEKPRYSKEFYRQLLKLSLRDSRVKWVMVLFKGVMTASHIFFVERSQIIDWHSYCDRDDPLRPNYLILDYIISFALADGIKEINLGGSPPGAETLEEFKERWGGQKTTYHYYTSIRGLGKLIYRGKRL
jgi:hypothetical protein